jgi:serine/threonine-protein kinase
MGGKPAPHDRLETLRAESAALQVEWERRYTSVAFQNPAFVDAYVACLQKAGGIALLEALHQAVKSEGARNDQHAFATRFLSSVLALRAGGPLAPGGVPISVFDYLRLGLSLSGRPAGATSGTLETVGKLLGLGQKLLDEPTLSGFRADVLSRFPSKVTPAWSVALAPRESGALPEHPPVSGVHQPLEVPADPEDPEPAPSESAAPTSGTPVIPEVPPAPEPPPRLELQSFIGKVFRGYKIVRVLGRGGFGAVFLAEHPTLPVKRALKFFLDVDRSGPGFEKFREQCLDEARLQATLKNENILEVVDAFEDQGYVVLVMEFIDGPNLGRLIDENNRAGKLLEPQRVLDLMIPVARGLAYAHSRGVVHRDLKPENILLDEPRGGIPKIADFGLARTLEVSGQRHHTAGHMVGTPIYMAPEQVVTRASIYDKRCDIYSLGIVLYQLCLGVPPFDHEDPFKIFEMHEKVAPKPLSLKLEGFPEELDRIILCCLEKRPEDRFHSADELFQAMESCRRNLTRGVTTVDRQAWERRKRSPRARRVLLAVALLLVVGVAALLGSGALKGWMSPAAKKDLARVQDSGSRDQAPLQKPEDFPRRNSVMPTVEATTKPGESKASPESAKAPSPPKIDPGAVKEPPPDPKKSEPKPPPVPLRQQILRYPVGLEDQAFVTRMLEAFSNHRAELLARQYGPLSRELETLAPSKKNEYTDRLLAAACEIVRLSEELVAGRRRGIADSKGELRLGLSGGGQAQGRVDHADGDSVTLISTTGAKTRVPFSQMASEEFLRDGTLPIAEVAYQALSGDAGKALPQALGVAGTREQVLLWYPVLARLARLEIRELAREMTSKAEAPLAGSAAKKEIVAALPAYPAFQGAIQSMAAAEKEILALYPYLPADFEAAKREAEAFDHLLDRSYSRVAATYPGSEAYPTAATLLLAGFLSSLEHEHDDLIAKRGWINYNWELRPNPDTREERLLYWDVLDGGGCVLRDPAGPRSLIMGRPHPRPAEGMLLTFDFEPLGQDRAHAQWRLNLKRDGGRNSYLRFEREVLSLCPLGLGPGDSEAPIGSAKIPGPAVEPSTHTCVLIPGEGLHVYMDGALVATFPKEDAIIPAQPSVAVLHGALSLRSVLVKKKPSK